jgi:hypothetical protein
MPPRTSDARGAGRLGCLGRLLLLAAAVYAASRFAGPYVQYLRFKEAMAEQAHAGGRTPDPEIRAFLAASAERLGLPPAARRVRIERGRDAIRISAEWSREVVLPMYRDTLHFQPSAEAKFTSEPP